jgi:hypothetical protein
METETMTRAGIRPTSNAPGRLSVWVDDPGGETGTGRRVVAIVSPDELQALVQAAYDRYGMLAEPSYATEAERTVRLEDEAEDMHLRSFADAWGRSIRGRS